MIGHATPQEAIDFAIKQIEQSGWIEFDGMNCNDYLDDDAEECVGWDGEDRRCECGNRRVSWETGSFSDGSFVAYAVAY
jgi:hypothetical protein